jgi:membrane protein
MKDISPQSPEARAEHAETPYGLSHNLRRIGIGPGTLEVTKRVAIGVYSDGFIHAGNLAYLALLTLYPFFIVLAALANLFGHSADTAVAVQSFLANVPRSVSQLLEKPIHDVLRTRTGALLWLGGLVGLWSVGSFIETVRDILRRAYGTKYSKSFWQYRLGAIAISVLSALIMMIAFSAQVFLTAVEQLIYRLIPYSEDVASILQISRLIPSVLLVVALWALFYTLTPSKYRYADCPKWPGALFTALWWALVMLLLPPVLGLLGGYSLTYGGLAGTIIALLFFWLVGLGVVIGAHLNAALAETPSGSVKEPAEDS